MMLARDSRWRLLGDVVHVTDGVGGTQHDVGDEHDGGDGHDGDKLLLHALVILLSAMSPIVDSAQKKADFNTNKIKYRV